ncbi:MAG: 3-oxoacyl-ACP reductase FabG [Nitrososphaerota archaeon]|nr:3-oxoacyl-ACP reductase FabG [Candidatus Bathyarchaeota archaeon]MDW8023214.1 3-oxoacyl-ACP reductase FabG [Nitrososphaerota archaeon]
MDLGLKGKVALVTGAARGIGRAIAIEFAKESANVVVNDVVDGSQVSGEIQKIGVKSVFIRADVSNMNEVEQMFSKVVEIFGRVDILVNNAGINKDALIHKMSLEDWDAVINVNLKGTFNCSKTAAKYMMEQKYGRIINISSVMGQMGNIGSANYVASKAGIIGLTKALALELARYGDITVNAVAPGFVNTEMTWGIPEKILKAFLERIPLRRVAEPEEIAHLVIFLASDVAKYITGQVIAINGGLYT